MDGQLHHDVWIEYLDLDECWQLLAMHPVGRIAVMVDDSPEIYPVNHVVDGRTILFRTDDGTKLAGILGDARACFEVDGLNLDRGTGWSVMVKGRAVELEATEELAHVGSLSLEFWGVGPKVHWIRLVPTEVTGRAIRRAEVKAPSQ